LDIKNNEVIQELELLTYPAQA